METVRINFCDFWDDFDINNNIFVEILKKYYFVELAENPDFLFYSCFGQSHRCYPDNKCIKIFYTEEIVHPDFNVCDYAIGHDYIIFEDRYFRTDHSVRKNVNISNRDLLNRKFCNFIYFNDSSGEGAIIRQDFCRQLMKYKHVDCPGRVMNNMWNAIEPRSGNWETGKLEFIKNYKFTIAFENVSSPGYITEKLRHPFIANSIPIYWGDPYVTREFNQNAFINCHSFSSFDEVIEYIKYLDANDAAYLEMLHQPAMLETYNPEEHSLEEFILNIIGKGLQFQSKDERHLWSLSSRVNTYFDKMEKQVFSRLIRRDSEVFEEAWKRIKLLPREKKPYKQFCKILAFELKLRKQMCYNIRCLIMNIMKKICRLKK